MESITLKKSLNLPMNDEEVMFLIKQNSPKAYMNDYGDIILENMIFFPGEDDERQNFKLNTKDKIYHMYSSEKMDKFLIFNVRFRYEENLQYVVEEYDSWISHLKN